MATRPDDVQYFRILQSFVGNFFAALGDFAHSGCYSMKNWGGFATLHCRCWSMDCSLEGNYSGPHNLLAPDL
jgi:hypothetical protein